MLITKLECRTWYIVVMCYTVFYFSLALAFLTSRFATAPRCTSSGPSARRRMRAHDQNWASGWSEERPAPPKAWEWKIQRKINPYGETQLKMVSTPFVFTFISRRWMWTIYAQISFLGRPTLTLSIFFLSLLVSNLHSSVDDILRHPGCNYLNHGDLWSSDLRHEEKPSEEKRVINFSLEKMC